MAHGVWDGYGVKTACFGGPTTHKTGGFGNSASELHAPAGVADDPEPVQGPAAHHYEKLS
eukprot:COSAG02_NODE_299_length_25349_cov_53.762020_4_plen_60_part_00